MKRVFTSAVWSGFMIAILAGAGPATGWAETHHFEPGVFHNTFSAAHVVTSTNDAGGTGFRRQAAY
jgi:hypothetical protein